MEKFRFFTSPNNSSPIHQLWRLFKSNHFSLVAAWLFLFFILVAIFAPMLAPYSPFAQHPESLLTPPAWHPDGTIAFPFGTDALGRDIFTRVLYGLGFSFGLAIVSVFMALTLGVLIGVFAGFSKGIRSSFLNHILDIALTMPSLLIAIVIVAILGPGIANTFWAVVLAMLPQFIHHIRTEVAELLNKDFIIAYKLDGAKPSHLFYYALLPNLVENIIIFSTMAISSAILDIAVLGFIGIGAQSPEPELGTMVSDSLDVFYLNPWTVMLPGLLLFLCILSTNIVGDGLRHALKERRLQ
ncbi:ABC transporter permease subunit [Psychrosphaera sp. B3R10]|uniref:ABC transporter permease subunit n=1 Tax=unclassified Psychrosphaera TaxID=2641570 RepID=UPI001C096826|nr:MULTISPECIES: ABC transporter permease subunit [unclassified Psychrosphaera]MBU2884114.1 ABC transporter permease subunit [Psychrosphaera sp. I2R16]MBU2989175.1 ABC transporter permease subunit [Psychrosphaera sp. B3R10]MDO6720009.1 ABC transporter permease subunit [Psychrosphaera sp. 1_MG-2023]